MIGYEREIEQLRLLSNLFGPTGCEDAVADWIESKLPFVCDDFCRDRMGNVIALIRAGNADSSHRRRVMISAHMDEVGMMITEICEDGLLRFDTVGGIHASVLEGRRVTVGDETHRVNGVIMSKAIHHKKKEERNKLTPISKMYIDIGASDREEAKRFVSVGSFGTFESEFYLFGKDNGYMKAKALDDRMGCSVMLDVMASLYADRPAADLDLYFCFTVREEIGLSGAGTAAHKIAPDLAIVLESTAVGDLPDTEYGRRVASLGAGGVLSVMDRSTVYDRDFLNFALQTAKKQQIPAQIKRYVSGGNDAGTIHKRGEGVRTLALSVPTRYLHSPSCVVAIEDYRSVRNLTEAMIREMTVELP